MGDRSRSILWEMQTLPVQALRFLRDKQMWTSLYQEWLSGQWDNTQTGQIIFQEMFKHVVNRSQGREPLAWLDIMRRRVICPAKMVKSLSHPCGSTALGGLIWSGREVCRMVCNMQPCVFDWHWLRWGTWEKIWRVFGVITSSPVEFHLAFCNVLL